MLKAGGGRTVAATFVTLGLAYGVWYSFAVFLVALLRDFGWSRSVIAGAFSTFTLVHGLLAYPIGWLCDRIGPRRLVLAGGVLLAAGLVLDGAVRQPWQLYLAFGVLTAFGVAAAGWVPAVILVQRWYPHRLGTVLGFTSAGIGVGIFVVVPLSQVLIDGVGWRDAFRTLGVVMAVWIVPAALWLVRDPPRPAAAPVGARAGGGDVSLRQAVATRRFWLIAVAQGAASFVNQMLLAHQVAYLVDHGVTTFVAASVVGVVGLGSILGKAGGGWASDMFGRELTYTVGIALVAAAGGLLATYHPIEPTVAVNFIVLMFVAVVLGGLGSIPGAFAGGLLIGLVQSLTLLVLPFQLQNVGVFITFLLVLYLRPQGLFGQRLRAV